MNALFTLPFTAICRADHDRVGGKCASLGEMTQAGVAVPPGFAVTTDAFAAMLDNHGLREEIARALSRVDPEDFDAVDRAAQAIRIRIRSHRMPADVEAAIRDAYAAMCEEMGAEMPVAVRSSATAEDMPDASFAGQQDTYLWVIGADAVVEKVRDCWASLYTTRAVAYREKQKIAHGDVLMSVAVQKMVNARAAGVAMSLDPNTGDRTRIVIDASWGLGEMVVSGVVTPDNYSVEKVLGEIIDRKISDKHVELVGDPERGEAVEREVDEDRRKTPCLADDEVKAIAQLAKLLERQNKCPQDVEWAIDADLPAGQNLLALQSRPETIWSQKAKEKPKNPYATGMAGIVHTLNNPFGAKQTKAAS
ncbi:PEP/pyruvate-binding domain-containing protein [Maritimibacter sp. DP1N21-5]|uniref:PEP/pyruvate-binding domain-containing protein n=1 Tax=Maritimibacter sp. DP1N21-5 TaxID=2836867 RepID=UPI001C43C6D6|nr:PEP/pyruvate-binding domain-containing protein [Maritimibacter sp. DP1N21-5]MBV7410673.1 phosphoenolpyruvate synthase [Maritimibacter sp. DP1N21-5]